MPIPLLTTFLWERFKTLGPKPTEFKVIDMVGVEDEDGNVKQILDKPFKMGPNDGPN